jgi:N-acetylglucosamine-6-sulfatase
LNRQDNPYVHQALRDGQLRLLMSVDDLVERLFAFLDRRGLRQRTWGVYASDNGFLLGEHHLTNKLLAYEESAHVPFRMAVPGAGKMLVPQFVSSIDVAPTFMDLAGDPSDHAFRGRSLVPLITGTARDWRRRLLIEGRAAYGYSALRTPTYKYIEWLTNGHRELYHLPSDPYELENIVDDRPALAAHLSRLLRRLKAE